MLSGDQYLAEARNNQVRNVKVEAPRGDIVDRNGTVLVKSRRGIAVQLDPQRVPATERDLAATYGSRLAAAERARIARHAKRARSVAIPAMAASDVQLARLYRRLGRAIGMSPNTIHREVITQLAMTPYSSVTIKTDVPYTVYAYIRERQRYFPGVKVQEVFLRSYPHDTLAAQLFGTVGEVSPDELKMTHFRGVGQGTRVGQSGIEYAYDRYLRGDDGATRVQVDALGRPEGELSVKNPVPGKQLKLSIDLGLQAEGQRAVARALGLAHSQGDPATAGAFVAMDPRNGEVLAMGSYPSFDPNVFAKPLTQAKFDAIRDAKGSPLYNRAISGLYPTGSTFKPMTALAALNSGVITPDTPVSDTGCIQVGEIELCNANKTPYGTVSLVRALQVSSDVFFYKLGMDTNPLPGQVIQTMGPKARAGPPDGHRHPGRGQGPDPRPRLAPAHRQGGVALSREEARVHVRDLGRPALDRGRQRQPRGRPGRPPGNPASDGRRLRGDRQRRPRRAPAPRPRGRGQHRPGAPEDRAARGAHRQDQSRLPRRRSWTGCTWRPQRRAAPRRRSSRAGRSPSTPCSARRAPRSARPRRPVLVRLLRPEQDAPDRRRGDDRAGRLRAPRPRLRPRA